MQVREAGLMQTLFNHPRQAALMQRLHLLAGYMNTYNLMVLAIRNQG